MNKDDYLEVLEAETELFLAAAAGAPLDTAIPQCGDWTLAELVAHQIVVWAFATANVTAGGEKSPPLSAQPDDETKLFEWGASVRTTMLEVLADADPAAPAWSFAANDQTAGFWQRRMVCETVVHRWDAESASGNLTPINPEIASEGIDEYTEVGLRFSSRRPNREYPTESLHLHCTDTAGEWTIIGDGANDFTVTREHAKGDAAVKGTAESLLLWIWGRPGAEVEIFGDEAVADVWQKLAP